MDLVTEEKGASDEIQHNFVKAIQCDYEKSLITYRQTTGLSPLLSIVTASDTVLLTTNSILIDLGVHDDKKLKEVIVRQNEAIAQQNEEIDRLNSRLNDEIVKIKLDVGIPR